MYTIQLDMALGKIQKSCFRCIGIQIWQRTAFCACKLLVTQYYTVRKYQCIGKLSVEHLIHMVTALMYRCSTFLNRSIKSSAKCNTWSSWSVQYNTLLDWFAIFKYRCTVYRLLNLFRAQLLDPAKLISHNTVQDIQYCRGIFPLSLVIYIEIIRSFASDDIPLNEAQLH